MTDLAVGREPPHDVAAEQAVLGAMLMSDTVLDDLTLEGADFWRPVHQTIYDVSTAMRAQGLALDAVTLAAELSDRKELERVGGAPYLHTLISMVPTVANATYYAAIVADRSRRRKMLQAGQRIQQLALDEDADPETLTALATAAVLNLDRAANASDPSSIESLLQAAMDEVELNGTGRPGGVTSPYLDLNQLVPPLRGGQLIVIGARPAVGKSIVSLDFARDAAICQGIGVALFSLEMDKGEIAMRALAAEGSVGLTSLRTGAMRDTDWQGLVKGASKIGAAPLYVDDTADSVPMIRSRARRLKAQHGIGLVIVDYLQLMLSPSRAENRQTAVADMSRGLKLMAKELELPVVALSQLNRGLEMRADKRPNLSDLRESGAIEQDADLVLLLHRPEMYDRDNPELAGLMEVIVAKHRNGPTGIVNVAFQGHYARCADLSRDVSRPWANQ